jgi:hypothetical protein
MKVNPWRVIIPVVLVTAVIAITTAQRANPVSIVEKTFSNARVFDCRMANDAASISCGLANMV